jgi:predicted MFS family arabinose efflux permease
VPSAQIGALTSVAEGSVGLASGLVETMREIGGAVGIAVVSTVLVASTRDAAALAGPAARQVAAFEGFQTAFAVIAAVAALGIVVAALAFPRSSGRLRAPAMEESLVSLEPEVVLDAAVVDPA